MSKANKVNEIITKLAATHNMPSLLSWKAKDDDMAVEIVQDALEDSQTPFEEMLTQFEKGFVGYVKYCEEVDAERRSMYD